MLCICWLSYIRQKCTVQVSIKSSNIMLFALWHSFRLEDAILVLSKTERSCISQQVHVTSKAHPI